jgi:hypothetical protein
MNTIKDNKEMTQSYTKVQEIEFKFKFDNEKKYEKPKSKFHK